MSKKSTALILGGLAALGALWYFNRDGGGVAGGGGGGGGILDLLDLGGLSPDEANSEISGNVPGGALSDIISRVSIPKTNPWNSALEISAYTGFEGSPTEKNLTEAGYNLPLGTYEAFKAQNPATTMTAAEYYSRFGAYEIAALTDPEYAFGAQQSMIALHQNIITGAEYGALREQGFVDELGQAVQPAGGITETIRKLGGIETKITTTKTAGVTQVSGTTPSGESYTWKRPPGGYR